MMATNNEWAVPMDMGPAGGRLRVAKRNQQCVLLPLAECRKAFDNADDTTDRVGTRLGMEGETPNTSWSFDRGRHQPLTVRSSSVLTVT